MAAIETNGLTKRFGSLRAVDNLNLTVQEGEIYGFLGPNGAGKSTTINMLLSLVQPTAGSATVLGYDIADDIRSIHDNVGVLPDQTSLWDRLSPRDHLEFVIETKEADDDPDVLLDRVGLTEVADRPAGGFSTGMAQRLRLAMALVDNPDLIILDEPTAGLDPNAAREVRRIILEENERGATVFFSSHIMEQVEAVCDRVGILRQGELVAEDDVGSLRKAASATIRMEVIVDEVPDTTINQLETIDAVIEATAENEETIVVTLSNTTGKADVIHHLVESGVDPIDFSFRETSLEDVFAEYTTGGVEA